MERVLITGGAGFIGIHTAITLCERGYKLVIVDSLVNSSYEAIKRLIKFSSRKKDFDKNQIIFYKGDIRDTTFLRKVFRENNSSNNKIDLVVHFAGLKSIAESFIKKEEYWDVNVNGTKKLLKVMEENHCFNIVFSSSASLYLQDKNIALNEDSEVYANNPYSQTKLEVENILQNIQKSNLINWKIISLRYFNPIGAHPSGLFGEFPLNRPNNLFPIICQAANEVNKDLHIYGNNWPTKDGTGIRDFIHVVDLAEGHLAAIYFLRKSKEISLFDVINLGTGKGTSVLELIHTFEKVNNVNIKLKFVERRFGDKAIVFADSQKALKLLNWKAKRSLEDMCKDGWSSMNKN